MKYLLDTNVFLWSRGAEAKLNERSKKILGSADSELHLSAVSSWEIAIKFALGLLRLPSSPAIYVPETLHSWRILPLEITHTHALAVGELPPHHRDPFDRMLIAQARAEDMVLLTADSVFEKYDVNLLFCGK